MTSEKRRGLLLITISMVLLFGLISRSYGESATIEYEYDEMGNVKKRTVTHTVVATASPRTPGIS